MNAVPAIDVIRTDASKVHAVLRTFFRIAESWGLDNEQARTLLGAPSRAQFYRLKAGRVNSLSRDMLERISYVLGIHKALRILFPDSAQADGWLMRPNRHPMFGGRPAMSRLLAGNVADLADVRRYLDAQRG
ncbi:MAG: MbcA/ParS/Xre antitoxin family protein [Xanthomonadales bacterium]|nr:MbcA/ParS/Xre antitoxin family protein [Xanthomonadales bacterium]